MWVDYRHAYFRGQNFLPDTVWNEKPAPEIGIRYQELIYDSGFWHVSDCGRVVSVCLAFNFHSGTDSNKGLFV